MADDTITVKEFLARVRVAREKWEALLAEVGEERMLEPGFNDDWTLKDVIAHITWYEREMVGMLDKMALQGSYLWDLSNEQRNIPIYEENKDHPLDEVLLESRRVYEAMIAGIEKLTDEQLNDPEHFADMPEDWRPWEVIASNCYEHYEDHTPDVRAWLARQ